MTDSHCGIIQIEPHGPQVTLGLGKPERSYLSTKLFDTKNLHDLLEHRLHQFDQVLRPTEVNAMSLEEALKSSQVSYQNLLQIIWRKIHLVLSYNDKEFDMNNEETFDDDDASQASSVVEDNSKDIEVKSSSLYEAIANDEQALKLSVIIRTIYVRYRHVFYAAHNTFQGYDMQLGKFGYPLYGGHSVEQCFLSLCTWILNRLPLHIRSVCILPSTFTIRHVWRSFVYACQKENRTTTVPEKSTSNHSSIIVSEGNMSRLASMNSIKSVTRNPHSGSNTPPHGEKALVTRGQSSPDDLHNAYLCYEKHYFSSFIVRLFEVQALLEHFAYVHSVPDTM
jgi:hypothetical protein